MKKKIKKQKERRKKSRSIHVIGKQTRPRDEAIARADLDNFFLDIIDKHHGGF